MSREKEEIAGANGPPKLTGHVTVRIAREDFKALKKLAAKEKNRRMGKVLRRILKAYLEELDRLS